MSDLNRNEIKNSLTEDDISFIMSNTDLERERIISWYADFKVQCPNNRLDKANFVNFYKKLIPGEFPEETLFCEAVFQAFDTDNNGFIDFGEFLISFWVRARGNLREKLAWMFDIYDIDRNNNLSLWELARMLKLIFGMKRINEDPYTKARQIFEKFDRSGDNRISKQEFIAGCTRDENIRNLLAPF